jgi:RNA 3'-terminal phosphate cyclase (ATP)
MIEIDGSCGEGGGAVLRIATGLSALTTKPVKIFNIRSKRPKPGLMPQHLNSVKAVAELSDAQLSGLEIGSTELTFQPGTLKPGNYEIDVKTAGSISLILQAFMIPAAFTGGPVKITIKGGTDLRWSPSIDYLQNVTLPILNIMGYNADIQVMRRGHYPRGGGILEVKIHPIDSLKPVNLVESNFKSVNGISHSVKLPEHVAIRQARAAEAVIKNAGFDINIDIEHSDNSFGSGSGIVLWTDGIIPLAGSSIGERGKKAEEVGCDAAKDLIDQIKGNSALDSHMGDQIIPYLFIAGNSSITTSKLTQHTLTNIDVAGQFIKRDVLVEGELGKPAHITVK